MEIREATSDEAVAACYPVLAQLRPNIASADDLIGRVARMRKEGYRLVCVVDQDGLVVAVAGFRVFEMLFRGRFLYVDDLVTHSSARSAGHGAALLAWLEAEARRHDCEELVLDSGVQRHDAHRFYLRERFRIQAYNFQRKLA